jgi:hypothetical protein
MTLGGDQAARAAAIHIMRDWAAWYKELYRIGPGNGAG